jgi:CRP-like cAMP-binding protein
MNGYPKQDCATCPVRVHCVYHLLNPEQREELEANKKYLERKKGTILYNEGFPATEFIMLIKGIIKKTTVLQKIGEVILSFSKAGDFIGLNSVSKNAVYTNSVVAFSDVKFCIFSDHLIVRFMKENPAVFNYVMGRFSDYTESVRKRMISLIYGNARKRTAESLLILSEQNKSGTDAIHISRDDLAAFAGITRETVSRILSEFKTSKIISFNKKSILIEHTEKLKVLSRNN